MAACHAELPVTARGVGVDGGLSILPRQRANQARDLQLSERLRVVVSSLEIEIAETRLGHETEAGNACRRGLLFLHDGLDACEHIVALAEHHEEAIRHGDIA